MILYVILFHYYFIVPLTMPKHFVPDNSKYIVSFYDSENIMMRFSQTSR